MGHAGLSGAGSPSHFFSRSSSAFSRSMTVSKYSEAISSLLGICRIQTLTVSLTHSSLTDAICTFGSNIARPGVGEVGREAPDVGEVKEALDGGPLGRLDVREDQGMVVRGSKCDLPHPFEVCRDRDGDRNQDLQ